MPAGVMERRKEEYPLRWKRGKSPSNRGAYRPSEVNQMARRVGWEHESQARVYIRCGRVRPWTLTGDLVVSSECLSNGALAVAFDPGSSCRAVGLRAIVTTFAPNP